MAKTVITTTPDDLGSPQVHMDRKKFDDFITDHGYVVLIDRAIKCPCKNRITGKPLPDCKNCGGTGWFYIDRQKSVIACTSLSNKNKYEVWTESNAGTVNITTRPEDKLGWMDKVSLTELESWFSQAVYLKLLEDNSWFSFLTYEPISAFDVFIFKNTGEALGYLTSDKYTLSGNKILVPASTITSFGLTDGEYCISIRYTHNPVYYIIDINRDLIKQKVDPNCTNNNKANLPLNCIGRRAHFVLDAADFVGDNLLDNTPTRTPINYDR